MFGLRKYALVCALIALYACTLTVDGKYHDGDDDNDDDDDDVEEESEMSTVDEDEVTATTVQIVLCVSVFHCKSTGGPWVTWALCPKQLKLKQ